MSGDLVDGEIHFSYGARWLQLIVQPLRCCPYKEVGSSIGLGRLNENLVFSPLHSERRAAGRYLQNWLAKFDHGQVIQRCQQMNDLLAIGGLSLNLLGQISDGDGG